MSSTTQKAGREKLHVVDFAHSGRKKLKSPGHEFDIVDGPGGRRTGKRNKLISSCIATALVKPKDWQTQLSKTVLAEPKKLPSPRPCFLILWVFGSRRTTKHNYLASATN